MDIKLKQRRLQYYTVYQKGIKERTNEKHVIRVLTIFCNLNHNKFLCFCLYKVCWLFYSLSPLTSKMSLVVQYLLLVTQLENTLSIQEAITFSGDTNIFHETTTANNSNRAALVCMEENLEQFFAFNCSTVNYSVSIKLN